MIVVFLIDLDAIEAFCPGVRRDFIIIPYHAKPDKIEQGLYKRFRGATQRVLDTKGVNQMGRIRNYGCTYPKTLRNGDER